MQIWKYTLKRKANHTNQTLYPLTYIIFMEILIWKLARVAEASKYISLSQ